MIDQHAIDQCSNATQTKDFIGQRTIVTSITKNEQRIELNSSLSCRSELESDHVYFQILIEHLEKVQDHIDRRGIFQGEKGTLILQIVIVK
jgi:hypothetical protein